MPANLANALAFIVNALASLYLLVLLLRLWLPILRADFRNPLAQGILKVTSPLVIPIRRILPAFGRVDTATVVVAFAIQYLTIVVTLLIYGATASIGVIAGTAAIKLIMLSVNLFAYAILIRVILSWIAAGQYNPAIAIVGTLTDPVLRPVQRIIPPMGGFDISPIFAMIGLFAVNIIVSGFLPLNV